MFMIGMFALFGSGHLKGIFGVPKATVPNCHQTSSPMIPENRFPGIGEKERPVLPVAHFVV